MRTNGGIRGEWCSRCYQIDEKDNEVGTKDVFAQAQFILAPHSIAVNASFVSNQLFVSLGILQAKAVKNYPENQNTR